MVMLRNVFGKGRSWAVQVVPFQRSAMGTLFVPTACAPSPTAVQSVEEEQEIAFSDTEPGEALDQLDPRQIAPAESPTAMQKVVLGQDTPWKKRPAGVGWRLHVVPFQLYTALAPTAMHVFAALQETEMKAQFPVVHIELPTIVQELPFQRSVRDRAWVVTGSLYQPTATQSVPDVHETDDKAALLAPTGVGVDWTVQLAPFPTSASVAVVAFEGEVMSYPTAVQVVAVPHDTPESPPSRPPVDLTLHDPLSQRSARV